MVFVTGDTHRNFERIEEICMYEDTATDDVIVILGDVGINYYGEPDDWDLKEGLCEYQATLLCVHGNHEMRPENISSYEEKEWRSGIVYWEPDYPNLLFAKCGEVYDLDGNRSLVIGGASSVDKHLRTRGLNWWADEQASDEIMARVEERLAAENWRVDIVLSHTCPYSYMPTDAFLPGIPQEFVDNTMEKWLDRIEKQLDYRRWYCGHFHTDQSAGDIKFLWHDYVELW